MPFSFRFWHGTIHFNFYRPTDTDVSLFQQYCLPRFHAQSTHKLSQYLKLENKFNF